MTQDMRDTQALGDMYDCAVLGYRLGIRQAYRDYSRSGYSYLTDEQINIIISDIVEWGYLGIDYIRCTIHSYNRLYTGNIRA